MSGGRTVTTDPSVNRRIAAGPRLRAVAGPNRSGGGAGPLATIAGMAGADAEPSMPEEHGAAS
jgi:hypothetical protein